MGFSAVGSLREEVRPRDFLVAGGVVDWTKGVSLLRMLGGRLGGWDERIRVWEYEEGRGLIGGNRVGKEVVKV